MDERPASCLPPPEGHPLPTSLRQGQRLGQLTSVRASVHHMHRARPHLPPLSASGLAVPTPVPARSRLWVCPGCFCTSFTGIFFVSSTPPSASCFLAIPLQTQNLIPPTQASRSEGTLQVSRAGCSPSCLERCPTIPAPRSPQMPISASSTGSPPGLCVPPLSVLGLGRPHMDPQKTPNSQRTLEKQPIGRCHAL